MDYAYSCSRDGKYVKVPKIEDLCLALKDKFLRQDEENDRIRLENKKLKEGIWEKEEVARLKEQAEKATEELYRGFGITKEESEAIQAWEREQLGPNAYSKMGVCGGCFTYIFTPTSLGTIGVVKYGDNEFCFRELN